MNGLVKISKVNQNLSLSVDVVNNLRVLSALRKIKGNSPAELSAIVEIALNEYFKKHKAEIDSAKSLFNETQKKQPARRGRKKKQDTTLNFESAGVENV